MSRSYRSDLRARQARSTRWSVVEAAAALFVARGYDRTTLDAVAEESGVSRRTVVNAVGGKAALLKLAWDWTLVGDDEPTPMADRPDVVAIRTSRDPEESLRLWARVVTETGSRAAALGRVLVAAADADDEAAALLATAETQRLEGARAFAQHLASLDALAVPVDRAAEAFWALSSGAVHRSLVIDRGWSTEEFAVWLEAQAAASTRPTPSVPR
ncbi:TetR/AcrR family transcriptional regulator [Actinomycetospora termitidis]|uniref:Helix-turn-helix domain-containing protein n=1 Tax=Actinomycetospora termitidis TaxID=3053470 RepID=A0ABT7MI97_9PSEU|nr:TetR/AcrR family transcriptional regulator [Actinomycetospora sp. Odt1-22]MDL5160405.1 helix-turn-helix domain-containing protein [Actinomycetospora sp. Odt1-22]